MSPRIPDNVTTTSSIDGWTIDQYLGPVAIHLVAGTGFFSDFAAGLSDIFGGRSGAYRTQLESLYGEALEQLVRAGALRGGNWIVGFHTDFDEISGQGKQMFMLVATGTAVRARRVAAIPEHSTDDLVVSGLEVSATAREHAILSRLANGQTIEAASWDFLTERRNPQAIEYAVRLAYPVKDAEMPAAESWRGIAMQYLGALPPALVSEALFRLLETEPAIAGNVLYAIRTLRLGRHDKALAMFSSDNAHVRWAALQSLNATPQSYSVDDIAVLSKLRVLAPNLIGRRPLVSRKKMFGGEKPEWECTCGTWVSADERCSGCQRDRYGLVKGDITPEKAVPILDARIQALRSIYGEPVVVADSRPAAPPAAATV